jgi:serine-threonine kinase receptor-associated protein
VVHLKYSEVTPKGSFIISACKDGKPMLRKGETGDWVGTFDGHKGAVWGATITKDASIAATGAADFTAKLWSVQTGSEIGSLQHKHIVKTVDFSQDSALLLTGCNDKLMRIFDVNKLEASPQELKGQSSPIKSALFGREDHTVLASDEGSEIKCVFM